MKVGALIIVGFRVWMELLHFSSIIVEGVSSMVIVIRLFLMSGELGSDLLTLKLGLLVTLKLVIFFNKQL